MSTNRKAAEGKETLTREIKFLGCFSYWGNSTNKKNLFQIYNERSIKMEKEIMLDGVKLVSTTYLMEFFGVNSFAPITNKMQKMRIKGIFINRPVSGKLKREKFYPIEKIKEYINR
jgi:hypothetical protein